jgi:hypothetical protein
MRRIAWIREVSKMVALLKGTTRAVEVDRTLHLEE